MLNKKKKELEEILKTHSVTITTDIKSGTKQQDLSEDEEEQKSIEHDHISVDIGEESDQEEMVSRYETSLRRRRNESNVSSIDSNDQLEHTENPSSNSSVGLEDLENESETKF